MAPMRIRLQVELGERATLGIFTLILGSIKARKLHRANLIHTTLKRKKDRPVSSPNYVAGIYPLLNLMSASHRMSESSLKVVRYITENPQHAASMSIGELAAATGSNKAAVVRVSKLSGYEGYRALRAALLENKGLMRAADLIAFDLSSSAHKFNPSFASARQVVKENIEVLQDTLALLDEERLLGAVNAISGAKHVFLVGFGTNAPLVQDAYQRFLKLQVPSSICSDAQILAKIVGSTGPDDLIFCISLGEASRETIEALQIAKKRKVPTIILTSVFRSAAAKLSDTVLISAVRRSPQTVDSVAENVAQLVVIGVICAIISLRKEGQLGIPVEPAAGHAVEGPSQTEPVKHLTI
jgi:DNA-binding MurR/RpiR family transcriptional regulator